MNGTLYIQFITFTLFSVHTLTVGGDLGPLGTLTIWHDDSGSSSDWYLQKVKSKYRNCDTSLIRCQANEQFSITAFVYRDSFRNTCMYLSISVNECL